MAEQQSVQEELKKNRNRHKRSKRHGLGHKHWNADHMRDLTAKQLILMIAELRCDHTGLEILSRLQKGDGQLSTKRLRCLTTAEI